MTITYITIPKTKLTLGTTEKENATLNAKITRLENGVDTALFVLDDTSLYPTTVTDGTAIQFDIKDDNDLSYTTLFKGIVRFPIVNIQPSGMTLTLSCLGAGYPLAEMIVGNEYGSQSVNPERDAIRGIINNSTVGIIPAYVNKILNGDASGYSIDAADARIDNLTGSIAYIDFPYKPALNAINDLIDLHTAISSNSSLAGPHWIVDTSSQFRLKRISADQTGWTHYYGGSQAAATLTYGVDYTDINLEKLSPEANYIIYYGSWRRPSNGDAYTEPASDADAAAKWDTGTSSTLTKTTDHMVGATAVKATTDGASGYIDLFYPHDQDAAWNLDAFGTNFIPTVNFHILKHGTVTGINLGLCSSAGYANLLNITSMVASADTWYYISVPVGSNYRMADKGITYTASGSGFGDWTDINWFDITATCNSAGDYLIVDGLHFKDANVCRVAYNSDYPGDEKAKMRLITDNIGKDDSLVDGDDSGLMAQLAHAELLRLQSDAMTGTVVTPLIKDILPGQCFSIQGTTYRITKIVHAISNSLLESTFSITDDLLNGRTKPRYEDQNRIYSAIRPEWQDRQASNIKAGNVDWRITRLTVDYAPP